MSMAEATLFYSTIGIFALVRSVERFGQCRCLVEIDRALAPTSTVRELVRSCHRHRHVAHASPFTALRNLSRPCTAGQIFRQA